MMGQLPDGNTYSDVSSDYMLVQGNADLQNGWVFLRVWTSQMIWSSFKWDKEKN